jgi:hypothetical protein
VGSLSVVLAQAVIEIRGDDMATTTMTVTVHARIPLRTKARMKLARLFARLGLLALTN